ncbi:MAG: hypothetical protein M1826_003961 [Phylliscum demangeonii]|nr:MAG: hypothetical protein M1826_003961 [Phylliscum demangeonii]
MPCGPGRLRSSQQRHGPIEMPAAQPSSTISAPTPAAASASASHTHIHSFPSPLFSRKRWNALAQKLLADAVRVQAIHFMAFETLGFLREMRNVYVALYPSLSSSSTSTSTSTAAPAAATAATAPAPVTAATTAGPSLSTTGSATPAVTMITVVGDVDGGGPTIAGAGAVAVAAAAAIATADSNSSPTPVFDTDDARFLEHRLALLAKMERQVQDQMRLLEGVVVRMERGRRALLALVMQRQRSKQKT